MSREYNKEEKISCVAEYQDSGMRLPLKQNARKNCNNLTNGFP